MKLWATGSATDTEPAPVGAVINFNANTEENASAFNQGHNLHTLTFTTKNSITIPVFPASCQ